MLVDVEEDRVQPVARRPDDPVGGRRHEGMVAEDEAASRERRGLSGTGGGQLVGRLGDDSLGLAGRGPGEAEGFEEVVGAVERAARAIGDDADGAVVALPGEAFARRVVAVRDLDGSEAAGDIEAAEDGRAIPRRPARRGPSLREP